MWLCASSVWRRLWEWRIAMQYNKSSYLYQQSSLKLMNSAMIAPPDLVVMAQQIQALTTNV